MATANAVRIPKPAADSSADFAVQVLIENGQATMAATRPSGRDLTAVVRSKQPLKSATILAKTLHKSKFLEATWTPRRSNVPAK